MTVFTALETSDFVQGFEPVGFPVRHGVHAVLVLRVRHEVLAELRRLLVPQVRRHLVALVDLVPDLPAVVAGDHNLLSDLAVLLHGARQLEPIDR